MFWWHILNVKKTDMLYKVYNAQTLSPVEGDWVNLLAADKKSFKLSLSDEEVKTISKSRMKTYVKKMGKELTLNYIDSLKEKHSKTQKFDSTKLSVAAYLTDNRFSKTERELLFKLRSSTLQVKKNFRIGNIDNNLCEICRLFLVHKNMSFLVLC